MMQRKHIDIFVDSLTGYFSHLDGVSHGDKGSLEISAPYLLQSDQGLGLDYTGMISVSGDSRGYIFVSANRSLLKFILLSLGEADVSERVQRDLIGEVANTIAGNARRDLGANFHISTPRVVEGEIEAERYSLSSRCYVVPFRWKARKAELIISI